MRAHLEGATYEAESRPPPDTESIGTLILDFPAFGTVSNKILIVFKLLSLWYFYSNLNILRQYFKQNRV
jgi:hypothetical protein